MDRECDRRGSTDTLGKPVTTTTTGGTAGGSLVWYMAAGTSQSLH
jgi:hypothetical protein